jgi:hypothetical protein
MYICPNLICNSETGATLPKSQHAECKGADPFYIIVNPIKVPTLSDIVLAPPDSPQQALGSSQRHDWPPWLGLG